MEQRQGDLKAVRITNPLYLGQIAPQIKDFVDKIRPTGITYETLYSYFANSIQHGHEQTEFWVAFYGDQPTAFAHFLVMPLPHTGKVCCDHIMSWNRKREPIELLIKKFMAFGENHRCPLYQGYAANETLFRVWRKAAHNVGYNAERTEIVNFIGRKK